ncbi:hypothetical protein [Sneathiella sp.]|uniref:hypothetical protein n=1 Tax=Sneathiella sp. TaxID=1964365 RepID=UPI003566B941
MVKIENMGEYEIHHPPDKLKFKVISDEDAPSIGQIRRRASRNMNGLREQFLDGVLASIAAITEALAVLRASKGGKEEQEIIFGHAHDIKGLGGTFGYPMIGSIGSGLCDLTDPKLAISDLNLDFIKIHTDVLGWAVAQKIMDESDPKAAALLTALDTAKTRV